MSIKDKLITIAENVQKVYKAGEKSQYDDFWDSFQQKGELVNYKMAFAGYGWNGENFKPKYDIKPTSASSMFQEFGGGQRVSNLKDILEKQVVVLDLSNAKNTGTCFYGAFFNTLPKIDVSGATTLTQMFNNMTYLKTIEELVLKDDGSQTIDTIFSGCSKLANLKVSGTIGKNFNLKWCPLSTASIVSIIEHLSDTSGATLTLNTNAKNNMEFPHTSAQSGITYNNWNELIATKTNWTIATASA